MSGLQMALISPKGRKPLLHMNTTADPSVLLEPDTNWPFFGGTGSLHLTIRVCIECYKSGGSYNQPSVKLSMAGRTLVPIQLVATK